VTAELVERKPAKSGYAAAGWPEYVVCAAKAACVITGRPGSPL